MMAFLRKYVFDNFLLKVVALIAAVLLWMAVARDPVAEVAITVPVEFQHVPENIEISTENIPDAQIRLRGPERTLRAVRESEVHATIDLANARPGERTYDLTGPQIHVPYGVQVVQVVPAQLHLAFDRQVKKEVPIRPRAVGLLPATTIRVDPPTATIVGPEGRVRRIDDALTDSVDASGVVGEASFPGVHVYVTDPLVRVLRPQAATITVSEESRPAAASRR